MGTFHRLSAHEESAFAKEHAGQVGAMRAIVCYTRDGATTEVYTGELEGKVVHPVKGDKPYGFNRLWLPDGYDLTLGEMRVTAAPALNLETAANPSTRLRGPRGAVGPTSSF